MTKPYNEQLALARRWDKCVDFGSPISSWTLEMLQEYRRLHETAEQPPHGIKENMK